VSDSPRENNLRGGPSVLRHELANDGVVDDSSLLGDLSGVGRVEVSCENGRLVRSACDGWCGRRHEKRRTEGRVAERERGRRGKVSFWSRLAQQKQGEGNSRSDHDTLGLEPLDVLGLLEEGVELSREGEGNVSFAFRWRRRTKTRLTSSWIASGTCLAVLRISSTSDWIMLEIPMFRTLPVAANRAKKAGREHKDVFRASTTARRAYREDPPWRPKSDRE